ncbi:hypothetical protein ACFV7R_44220 [Streptomyces sp. NPDC059866]|uniref:hypothetical protein n=1 Tax=Streptomyces sp. NPDC059866 TaxID=3346978 RepID=UPI00364E702C
MADVGGDGHPDGATGVPGENAPTRWGPRRGDGPLKTGAAGHGPAGPAFWRFGRDGRQCLPDAIGNPRPDTAPARHAAERQRRAEQEAAEHEARRPRGLRLLLLPAFALSLPALTFTLFGLALFLDRPVLASSKRMPPAAPDSRSALFPPTRAAWMSWSRCGSRART